MGLGFKQVASEVDDLIHLRLEIHRDSTEMGALFGNPRPLQVVGPGTQKHASPRQPWTLAGNCMKAGTQLASCVSFSAVQAQQERTSTFVFPLWLQQKAAMSAPSQAYSSKSFNTEWLQIPGAKVPSAYCGGPLCLQLLSIAAKLLQECPWGVWPWGRCLVFRFLALANRWGHDHTTFASRSSTLAICGMKITPSGATERDKRNFQLASNW